MKQIIKRLSFGERYVAAGFVYAGLGLVMLALSNGPSRALANTGCDGEYNFCPPGEICCHGHCIPDTHVCCDDGTSGPAETCTCCTGCQEECSDPSTVVCEEE